MTTVDFYRILTAIVSAQPAAIGAALRPNTFAVLRGNAELNGGGLHHRREESEAGYFFIRDFDLTGNDKDLVYAYPAMVCESIQGEANLYASAWNMRLAVIDSFVPTGDGTTGKDARGHEEVFRDTEQILMNVLREAAKWEKRTDGTNFMWGNPAYLTANFPTFSTTVEFAGSTVLMSARYTCERIDNVNSDGAIGTALSWAANFELPCSAPVGTAFETN